MLLGAIRGGLYVLVLAGTEEIVLMVFRRELRGNDRDVQKCGDGRKVPESEREL